MCVCVCVCVCECECECVHTFIQKVNKLRDNSELIGAQ